MTRTPRYVLAVLAAMLMSGPLTVPAAAEPQDDARTGGDAGDTFEAATPILARGPYSGRLDRAGGDRHDYYRFFLPEGAALSVLVGLSTSSDPVTMLDPNGLIVDTGAKVFSVGVSASAAFTTEVSQVRLAVHRAVVAGEYRLHLQAEQFTLAAYSLCFMNCEGTRDAPNDLIFGGSLPTTDTKVLLIPPAHGDLGNPLGPNVLDYINATLRGIRTWTAALKAFASDYSAFDYLRQIKVRIEVFDGASPIDPAGYDVIIGYVAAGPAFRGVAGDTDPDVIEGILREFGLGDNIRYTGRVIALSLFGSSPRAGQVLYDFPEVNDLEIVTVHEFGHTFGLGHTTTWHQVLGPDLMNSPAPFVYGDGSPAGAGIERTAMKCLSSLNLYGMAELYRWAPTGRWEPSGGSVDLPPDMPYKWYCSSPVGV